MKGSTPQCHRDPLRARGQEQVCFHDRRECSVSPSCFRSWAVSSEASRKGDSFSPSWRCCSDVCCKLWRCPKQSTESRWASELALPGRTSPPALAFPPPSPSSDTPCRLCVLSSSPHGRPHSSLRIHSHPCPRLLLPASALPSLPHHPNLNKTLLGPTPPGDTLHKKLISKNVYL